MARPGFQALSQKAVDKLIRELNRFDAGLRGKSVQGLRKSGISQALLKAGGIIRDAIKVETLPLDEKRWWNTKANVRKWGRRKNYPKYWSLRYHRLNDVYTWTTQKRPTKILKNSGRVKITSKSTPDDTMVAVYIMYSRKKGRWDRDNAWYARWVESGTGPGKKGKRPWLHVPTKAYRFYEKGLNNARANAGHAITGKLSNFINTFPFRK